MFLYLYLFFIIFPSAACRNKTIKSYYINMYDKSGQTHTSLSALSLLINRSSFIHNPNKASASPPPPA